MSDPEGPTEVTQDTKGKSPVRSPSTGSKPGTSGGNGTRRTNDRVGQRLEDRYVIERNLDAGGMGEVWLAHDERLQRRVVVKFPHAEMMARQPNFRERFVSEIRDLTRHEHPSILQIQDSGEIDGLPFAVLQFLGGGNLQQRIDRAGGRMTAAQILEWLPTMARALDFVHANDCLHRDVKPANILFNEQGSAFLSDFGISTAMGAADPDAATVEPSKQLTAQGGFIGSAAYAPPEAIDRLLTPAYDQYSLACVVYLALTGELPYTGKTNEAILVNKKSEPPPPIKAGQLTEPLPRAATAVVRKALSIEPGDRYESCEAFAQAFADAVSTGSMSKGPRWGTIGVALGSAAVAVGLAALLMSSSEIVIPTDPTPSGMIPIEDGDPQPITPPVTPPITPPVKPVVNDTPGVAILTQPKTVRLGWTEAETTAALEQCNAARPAGSSPCDREWFTGENDGEVTLAPYAIDATEVTNARFAEFVESQGGSTLAEVEGGSMDGPTVVSGLSWRTPYKSGSETRRAADHPNDPVVHVAWAEAQDFCAWAGGRLPTDMEWEYAARGDERRTYPWGDTWDPMKLRFEEETTRLGLEPVGTRDGATPEGVKDLAGSVWEWTSSRSGQDYVLKGGSYDEKNPSFLRSAVTFPVPATRTSINTGFRCVYDLGR